MGKDGPPLYEFVHRSSKTSKQGMQLPTWMRKGGEEEGAPAEGEVAQPSTELDVERHEAPPTRTISVPATDFDARPAERSASRLGANVAAAKAWSQQMVAFRLPRSTLVLLGAGAVVAVAIVFAIGHKLGRMSVASEQLDYDRAMGAVRPAMEEAPKPLIPRSVAGVEDGGTYTPPRGSTSRTPGGRESVPPPPSDAGASGDANDPREPGLNYFRLIELPTGSDEVTRMIRYLSANGVDAAAIPVQNGRSVKILALKGFAKPLSDPEAARYSEQLKHLGRKWKAEHNGSSDWQDMIPEKYRPGRT